MAVNPNKLTEKAQEAPVEAQGLAQRRRNTQLEAEHLLYALAGQEGGVVPAVLAKLGVEQSMHPGRRGGLRLEAGAVVFDYQLYTTVAGEKFDRDGCGARVLAHVIERFLGDVEYPNGLSVSEMTAGWRFDVHLHAHQGIHAQGLRQVSQRPREVIHL